MALSLNIVPADSTLNLYGEPDSTSAYSLSGHVALSLSSPFSFFEPRRTARVLLQSLSLTFEGQTEIFTPATGYSALRLCSITHELAPSEPIELTNEGHEDSEEPSTWNFIFNIPIPGWLPATTTLGIEDIGIRYGLYASAKFSHIDEQQVSGWGFATLCAPFRSRVKTSAAMKDIKLRRYIHAPSHEEVHVPCVNYLVNSITSSAGSPQASSKRIPPEVLSCIQVLTSVQTHVNMKDNTLPVTVRMRTKDLSAEECKKLQVTDISVDIIQQEKIRFRPSASYLSRFPLPPKEMQPPRKALIDPHPLNAVYDVGLYVTSELSESVCRQFSLLPSSTSGKYKLEENNYAFVNDNDQEENPTWYTMETTVPFVQRSPIDIDADMLEWAGPANIRATGSSPLYTVSHDVHVAVTCTYDIPGGPPAAERLTFKIPVTFARVPERLRRPRAGSTTVPMPCLPAYSQLYDRNGEQKIDYSVPLPLYTPPSAMLVDMNTPLLMQGVEA
ncbi:hypothetical protein BJ165DRAFT_1413393 [Panaeolus papilionaceus]|nr:hypothetical protein BJ165DRAFT_1413393 [Panaeolus papilionaceus]